MNNTQPPVSAAADRLKAAARDWGARPDQPEGAVLESMADLLTAFEEKLDTSRGLPMEKIEAALRRASKEGLNDAAQSIRREFDRRSLAWFSGVAAIALVAGIAAGYAGGFMSGRQSMAIDAADIRAIIQSNPDAAHWLASVARNNNLSQVASDCRANQYITNGVTACRVQMWSGDRLQPQ